ncbi:hypothetical protein MHU86_1595 [Fragilaria crotonensis]|nr:hypothetical protein MHU86_1595 [Fragilaria crotonensis]
MDPNIFEDTDGIQLKVYWHSFQIKKQSYFFWITKADGITPPPIIPSQRNALNWEEDCVLKRLIIGARAAHSLTIDMTIEPQAKRSKISEGARIETTISDTSELSLSGATQAAISNSLTSSWWESGDARKLFRPSTSNYEANECVKEIVMERIELLESVNRKGKSWTRVVEPLSWNMETCPYSESDVFTLRFRSKYLALALRQFVLNMSGDLRTQWTWKRCLLFAIETMNDIGVEYYSSNYRTLARWHRKLAKNRRFFCKTPEAKALFPPFFCDNPDAMEAFKKYGVANIQDLRVELMYNYVHQDLIPKLLQKAEKNGLFNDDSDECNNDVQGAVAITTADDDNDVEVTPITSKDLFLRMYGLQKVGITTIARWMHAAGFRYKKRGKHYFVVDGHEQPETLAY